LVLVYSCEGDLVGTSASFSWMESLKMGLSSKIPKAGSESATCQGEWRADLHKLLPIFRRYWRKGAAGFVLVVITAIMGLPQPLITRYLIDSVILGSRRALLFTTVGLIVASSLMERILSSLQRVYFACMEQRIILDIQQELYRHTLRLPMSFFDRNETGSLMSRLSADVQGLRGFLTGNVIAVPANFLRFAGGLCVLFYLEWRLALSVVIIAPVFLLAVTWFSARLHALSHRNMETQASMSGQLEESLSSIALIKAFSSEGKTVRRLVSNMKAALHISLEQQTVDTSANLVLEILPGISRGMVLAIGAYWVMKHDWTLGSLLAFQAYLGYVFGPAQYLASTNLQLQSARASLERISALFAIVPEEDQGKEKVYPPLSGHVEFRNISFSYDGRHPVLENISFSINPGERIAIVGPSGVGKTTLVSLILRFYKPSAGEIFFDGRPASDYDVSSLRDRIGFVGQNSLLLSGTIMENLRYGNADAAEDQVLCAAKAAGIHSMIERLPDGYNSILGGKGINLSEGQRQRLSIARALVKAPDILVFDEPTSALDGRCERSILNLLPPVIRRKTFFVVTHRMSIAEGCDRILLLHENRLMVGSHDSLLESSPYYRSLFDAGYRQMDTNPAPFGGFRIQ
jgi:ABC-type bacteriocin/lantibiotic exporter with double-glycine peptidase domain